MFHELLFANADLLIQPAGFKPWNEETQNIIAFL